MARVSHSILCTSFITLGISTTFLISGCAPPTLQVNTVDTSMLQLDLPEKGMMHKKKAGQVVLSYSLYERQTQRAAVMIDGYSKEAGFHTTGYHLNIPKGAKGLLVDDYAACFNSNGGNEILRNSAGKLNFCFFDTDKDQHYDMAMPDSINSWGRFSIVPIKYSVAEFNVGYDDVHFKKELLYLGDSRFEYRVTKKGSGSAPVSTRVIDADEWKAAGFVEIDGAQLRVSSTAGDLVKYSVISHFSR